MFNKLKERINYFKNIRKGTSIPMFYCVIDLSRPKEDKNCTVNIRPNIINRLSELDRMYVESCLDVAIDKIRDNVDFTR